MQVSVDGYLINQEVEELLIVKYGLDKETSENIALDVEKILEENNGN